MIVEIIIICITSYALLAPLIYAKAYEIRERAHKLELENDGVDFPV